MSTYSEFWRRFLVFVVLAAAALDVGPFLAGKNIVSTVVIITMILIGMNTISDYWIDYAKKSSKDMST